VKKISRPEFEADAKSIKEYDQSYPFITDSFLSDIVHQFLNLIHTAYPVFLSCGY